MTPKWPLLTPLNDLSVLTQEVRRLNMMAVCEDDDDNRYQYCDHKEMRNKKKLCGRALKTQVSQVSTTLKHQEQSHGPDKLKFLREISLFIIPGIIKKSNVQSHQGVIL